MNTLEVFFNKIRYYHRCIVAIKYFRRNSNKYVCLEIGNYYVTCYHRIYLIKRGVSKKNISSIGVEGTMPSFLAKIVLKERPKAVFTAHALMSTNGGVRYFNFTEKKTFRIFSSTDESELYKQRNTLFSPYFKNTCIAANNEYCLEKLIESKPRSFWSRKEINNNFITVYEKYIDYLGASEITMVGLEEITPKTTTSNNVYLRLAERLKNEIGTKLKVIPLAYCHCDLHFGNTLFEGEDVYLIDFENVRKDVFFYDLFNMMFVEFNDYKNTQFVDYYLNGESIIVKLMQKAFEKVGACYNPEDKLVYFKIFLLSRLSHYIHFFETSLSPKAAETKIREVNLSINNMLEYITIRK